MTLSIPPGGIGADLVLLRMIKEPISDDVMVAVHEELQRLERAVSPSVLPILDSDVGPEGVSIAYPWRDGLPLAGALARAREAGLLPPVRVAGRMIAEALEALVALHSMPDGPPIVHGAFRADSLWIGFDGRLQMCDLGLASALSRLEQPSYVERDPAADVLAAARLMHVVLTGVTPSPSANGSCDPRQDNMEVPDELAEVVLQASHPDPGVRFADAAELKAHWDAALEPVGGAAMQNQVSRWLCTIFPANHPLVAALRMALAPFQAGIGLPINEGPILSHSRLPPVPTPRAPPIPPPQGSQPPPPAAPPPAVSGRNAPVPTTSGRLAPVVDPSAPVPATSGRQAPVVVAPSVPLPAPHEAELFSPAPTQPGRAAPVVDPAAPVPATSGRAAVLAGANAPVPSASGRCAPVPTTSGRAAPVVSGSHAPVPVTSGRGAPVPATSGRAAAMAAAPSVDGELNAPVPETSGRRTPGKRKRSNVDLESMIDELRETEAPVPPRRSSALPIVLTIGGMLAGGAAVFFYLQQQQQMQAAPVVAQADPLARLEEPVAPVTPRPAANPPREPARRAAAEPPRPKRATEERRAPRKSAPAAAPDPVDDGDAATLALNVTPWANVWVDGKRVGRTPMKPLKLSPGRHKIKFENPEWRASRTESVDMQSGMSGELTVTFTPPN